MAQNKTASIPAASHGLHKHSYNYPWLGSMNFCEVLPCYINTLRAGERDEPRGGLFSQLMPIIHNAFVTGRYNFKAIYVPFFRVWRPWTAFVEQTEFNFSEGVFAIPDAYPYVISSDLNSSFCDPELGYVVLTQDTSAADIAFAVNSSSARYYIVTEKGQRVLKILMALGITPNWVATDTSRLNILAAMCYIKAFADYYFPNQYVGNSDYHVLSTFFNTVQTSFSANLFLQALEICSLGFYDGSVFENCWDNPVTPNVLTTVPDLQIYDITNDDITFLREVVDNTSDNKTPIVPNVVDGGFSQYIINALKSVSMWMKRKQLAGARLIDRFLVSRGIALSTAENDMSFFMGQRNVEIDVRGVENNSNDNLGELAGRGAASTDKEPLSFKIRADYDGCFLIICHAVPDASFPVPVDGFTLRQNALHTYTAEYDKLGPVDIPVKAVGQTFFGPTNLYHLNRDFGFAQNYWDEVQERPRLIGDFVLNSRGSTELSAYHSFRILAPQNDANFNHSYGFIRQSDNSQYSRFFYSSKSNSLMVFLRWFGNQYKEKLPLGDSYEWDDDETNRRVNIVVNGPQK